MARERMSYNPATLGVALLDESTLGPNANELKAAIRALAAPENKEVLEVIYSYDEGGVNVDAIPFGSLALACKEVTEYLTRTGRMELLQKAADKLEERIGKHSGLRTALAAVAAKDLVGTAIHQRKYDLMTANLRNFLEVTVKTAPTSPERSLVIDLFLSGSTIAQALQTAQHALLQ